MGELLQPRYAGASGTAAVDKYGLPLTGFKISGLGNANAIAVCMYRYDDTQGRWTPYTG